MVLDWWQQISRQERVEVVYSALQDCMSVELLSSAMEVFNRQHADEPVFAPSRITNSFRLFAPEQVVSAAYGRLLKLKLGPPPLRPGQELPKVDVVEVAAALSLEDKLNKFLLTAAEMPAQLAVFNYLLASVSAEVAHISAQSRADFFAALTETMPLPQVSSQLRQTLTIWCAHAQQPVRENLSRQQLADIIHAIYVWLCEYIGPVKSDALFLRVCKAMETIPIAARFSPKNFL